MSKRLLAFGDVHGCRAQLRQALQQAGLVDAAGGWIGRDVHLVGIGDYVDRGPDSRGVIDDLLAWSAEAPAHGSRLTCLQGNHEAQFLGALNGDENDAFYWKLDGAEETAASYGMTADEMLLRGLSALPPGHLAFLSKLPTYVVDGETLFVHAGLDPDVPLDEQKDPHWPPRWRWLNLDSFFYRTGYQRVVFGHVVHPQVTTYDQDRIIAIDTGAVYRQEGLGRLSLIELGVEPEGYRLVAAVS